MAIPHRAGTTTLTELPIAGPQAVQYLHNDAATIAAVGRHHPVPGRRAAAPHGRRTSASWIRASSSRFPSPSGCSSSSSSLPFNVLNQQFYGTPDPEIEDPSFQQTYFNTGTNRNLQWGGKIIF